MELSETLNAFLELIPKGGTQDKSIISQITNVKREALAIIEWDDLFFILSRLYFPAAVSQIVAEASGAIASEWYCHGRYDQSDNSCPEHLKRHGNIFMVRDNWAQKAGYCKPGAAGYNDEITQPAEEVGCRCFWVYKYGLRKLPEDMLTEKGRDFVAEPVLDDALKPVSEKAEKKAPPVKEISEKQSLLKRLFVWQKRW